MKIVDAITSTLGEISLEIIYIFTNRLCLDKL